MLLSACPSRFTEGPSLIAVRRVFTPDAGEPGFTTGAGVTIGFGGRSWLPPPMTTIEDCAAAGTDVAVDEVAVLEDAGDAATSVAAEVAAEVFVEAAAEVSAEVVAEVAAEVSAEVGA